MLDAFLERMAATPFLDGKSDCVMTVADWVLRNGYADPAAPYRGRYHSALGRERIIRREGGLLALMSAGAARSGLSETASPVQGAVGLVALRDVPLAAICVGDRWAFKAQGGLLVDRAEVIKAWGV